MDDKHLDTLLEQVHAELQRLEHVDEEGRKLLQELDDDIHSLLKRTGETEALSIRERIQQALERFEVKYPTLTTLLSEISAVLSNAGI
jgi:predicted DNA-binding protein